MDISKFVEREIGPGLRLHSTQLTNDISFHVAGPADFSFAELLVAELRRELMIEIVGLDDRQRSLFTKDPLLKTVQPSEVQQCLLCTISNKDLKELFGRLCELVKQ